MVRLVTIGFFAHTHTYLLKYPYTQLTSLRIIPHHFDACFFPSIPLHVFVKGCIAGLMDVSLAEEENYTLVVLGENREKNASHLNVLVQSDLS